MMATISALVTTPALAQQQGSLTLPPLRSDSARQAPHFMMGALALPGSEAEERARLEDPAAFSTVRTPRLLTGRTPRVARHLVLIAPDVRFLVNSALPHSINEGALWAGRGANTLVTAGVAMRLGPVSLQLAPQFAQSQNTRFQVIPFPQGTTTPARNVWSHPYYPPASSIDMPLRFGDRPLARLSPGQSHLHLDLTGLRVGVSTEQRWWGPTIRHPLVLGANTEGFAHAFIETPRAITTPLGKVQAQWLLGTLRESAFFDDAPGNDVRAINGLHLAVRPRFDTSLTIGITRVVMSTRPDANGNSVVPPFARGLDVFRAVRQQPTSSAPVAADGIARDQLTSIYAHYAFPAAGFEAWLEWARFAEPTSMADLLEYPAYSHGYSTGLQWSRPLLRGRLRVAGEATNTEPDATIRVRPVAPSYTSRAVPQGFTHRGRTLAHPFGPGASGQWLTTDWFGDRWRVGAFGGRIRWNSAQLWEPIVPQLKLEDVTLLGGGRLSVRFGPERLAARLGVEYTAGLRLSYLNQSKLIDPLQGKNGGVDIINHTVAVTWSTVAFR